MDKLVIDLFSGTKSLRQPCIDLGLDYFSVDNNPALEPDLVADIYAIPAEETARRIVSMTGVYQRPFMVWASPPCTHFSVASIGKNWDKSTKYGDPRPKNEEAARAVRLIHEMLWLIVELMPRWWFVENPRGMLRRFEMMRTRPCMNTVCYCQYGDTRQKPTDIWHNNPSWIPRPMCKPGAKCHESAPRGSRTGTQGLKNATSRGAVPYDLLREILESCLNR